MRVGVLCARAVFRAGLSHLGGAQSRQFGGGRDTEAGANVAV